MQQDLNRVIEQVSKEKGISTDSLQETIEQAMVAAARRIYGLTKDIEAQYNPDTNEIDLFEFKTVVDDVEEFPGDHRTDRRSTTCSLEFVQYEEAHAPIADGLSRSIPPLLAGKAVRSLLSAAAQDVGRERSDRAVGIEFGIDHGDGSWSGVQATHDLLDVVPRP